MGVTIESSAVGLVQALQYSVKIATLPKYIKWRMISLLWVSLRGLFSIFNNPEQLESSSSLFDLIPVIPGSSKANQSRDETGFVNKEILLYLAHLTSVVRSLKF